MKKNLLIVLAMALLVSLTGCSGYDENGVDIGVADDYDVCEYENEREIEDKNAEVENGASETVELPRVNLAELFNWETREFEDIRHLLGELIDVESVTDYEILGGGGVTFRSYNFENGNRFTFWFDYQVYGFSVDFEQAADRTQIHFNGIDGTSQRSDVISLLGEPDWAFDQTQTERNIQYTYEMWDPNIPESERILPPFLLVFILDDDLRVIRINVGRWIN